MPHVDKYVSVTEAKNKLLDLIRHLHKRNEVLAITREGAPAAVLLSTEQYDGLVETIELLADQKAMRALRRSWRQGRAGTWGSDRAVFGREKA